MVLGTRGVSYPCLPCLTCLPCLPCLIRLNGLVSHVRLWTRWRLACTPTAIEHPEPRNNVSGAWRMCNKSMLLPAACAETRYCPGVVRHHSVQLRLGWCVETPEQMLKCSASSANVQMPELDHPFHQITIRESFSTSLHLIILCSAIHDSPRLLRL